MADIAFPPPALLCDDAGSSLARPRELREVGGAPSFRVRNTFIDTSAERSPSLERFYREREVHTCPSGRAGCLKDALCSPQQDEEQDQLGPERQVRGAGRVKRALHRVPSVSSLQTVDTDVDSSAPSSFTSCRDVYGCGAIGEVYSPGSGGASASASAAPSTDTYACSSGSADSGLITVPPTPAHYWSESLPAGYYQELTAATSCVPMADRLAECYNPATFAGGMDMAYAAWGAYGCQALPYAGATSYCMADASATACGLHMVGMAGMGERQVPHVVPDDGVSVGASSGRLPSVVTVCALGLMPAPPAASALGAMPFATPSSTPASAPTLSTTPPPKPPPAAPAPTADWRVGVPPPPPSEAPRAPPPAVSATPPPPPPPPPAAPAPGTKELPSVGSAGHAEGTCKPCAFFHTAGCETGVACKFCHLCDADEKKRRRREKIETRRREARSQKDSL